MNFKPWDSTGNVQVIIDELLSVSCNNGILLWNWIDFSEFVKMERWREVAAIVAEHYQIEPARLICAIETGILVQDHDLLRHAHGLGWPDKSHGPVSLDRFHEFVRISEARQAGADAKRIFSQVRRREFQGSRPALILKMLDSGTPYRCAHADCAVMVDLTIDHKLALSRGGTDDLANLQFMCAAHNSAKGDRDQ